MSYKKHDALELKNKAAGDVWALFTLGAQPQLVAEQQRIIDDFNLAGVDFSPIPPDEFHITAVYSNGTEVLSLTQWFEYSWDNAFAVIIDGIGTFETDDGYAIYLRVRQDYVLRDMQYMLFHAMTRTEGEAQMVSAYSVPDNWVAHITMGYSSTGFMPPTQFTPFSVICNSIEIGDENHNTIMEVQLKGAEDMALVEKSFPIQIVTKGIHENAEGDLVIPIIGQPFRGPVDGKADLEGDWFHKGTVLPTAEEYATFWDHGRDANYLRTELKALGLNDEEIASLGDDFGLGKKDIAKAIRTGITDEGVFYDIIVNRNTKYKSALRRLAEEGKIGGSGEYKFFEYDKASPGKVDYAAMVGMALTPSPYNIEAKVLKGVELKESEMAAKAKDVVEVPAKDAVVPAVTEPEKKPSLTEALTAKGAELDAAVEGEVKPETITITAEQFKAMNDTINALTEKFDGIEKAQADFITDMTGALPLLGEVIAKSVIAKLGELRNKSAAEISAEDLFVKKTTPAQVGKAAGSSKLTHKNSVSMSGYPGSN